MPENRKSWRLPVVLYIDWKSDVDPARQIVEETKGKKDQSPEAEGFAEVVLTGAYEQTCRLFGMLFRDFEQYWLLPPKDPMCWSLVFYYSEGTEDWHGIRASDDFPTRLTKVPWGEHARTRLTPWEYTVLSKDNRGKLQKDEPVRSPSFPEEMIAFAFSDLQEGRIRSSVVHASIALESTAKRGLEYLLENRLKGLEEARIIEAITREISTITLAQLVFTHLVRPVEKKPEPDWAKINTLYQTRNNFIHRNQRRFPDAANIYEQAKEVWKYVRIIEALIPGE
jgi:hypothetical protein